jgi:mannose-1-phosphate guanylyltransferase
MKAFLLAAGLGTRLRPYTDSVPKCMIPFSGTPLLQIWLELLGRHGVTDVLVNTHYLPEPVREFAREWRGAARLHLIHEPELLGSAGTLVRNWEFARGEESVLVCNADNLTDIDVSALGAFHRRHTGALTLALFRPANPEECGVVELNADGKIASFEEKPAKPRSPLANGGIYLMRTAAVEPRLPASLPADIGRHLLPACLDSMYGWEWPGMLIDIGSPELYHRGQEAWASRPR